MRSMLLSDCLKLKTREENVVGGLYPNIHLLVIYCLYKGAYVISTFQSNSKMYGGKYSNLKMTCIAVHSRKCIFLSNRRALM